MTNTMTKAEDAAQAVAAIRAALDSVPVGGGIRVEYSPNEHGGPWIETLWKTNTVPGYMVAMAEISWGKDRTWERRDEEGKAVGWTGSGTIEGNAALLIKQGRTTTITALTAHGIVSAKGEV